MALAIDAEVGGEDSNSYGTIEEADTYFERDPTWKAIWDALSDAGQIGKMVSATSSVDLNNFLFSKVDTVTPQALEFPRNGATTPQPNASATTIPVEVKEAQFQTLRYLHQTVDATTGQIDRDLKTARVEGVIDVEFLAGNSSRNVSTGWNLETVRRLLTPWLGNENSFQMVK